MIDDKSLGASHANIFINCINSCEKRKLGILWLVLHLRPNYTKRISFLGSGVLWKHKTHIRSKHVYS